jgi:alpha-D-ribose 1-methylphosphonate 5-triphosphate synthase subunit PhnG
MTSPLNAIIAGHYLDSRFAMSLTTLMVFRGITAPPAQTQSNPTQRRVSFELNRYMRREAFATQTMKLDRNINPERRGKYALLKLRNTGMPLADIRFKITQEIGAGVLQFGDNDDTEFFVIKLKDKYAGAALHAYAEAAKADDMEYAAEIDALAQNADRRLYKHMPD